jgi:hypothetical protein
LNALVFLYGKVLQLPLGNIGDTVRAKRPPRLPVVLSHDEAMAVITALKMPNWLMVSLLARATRNTKTNDAAVVGTNERLA